MASKALGNEAKKSNNAASVKVSCDAKSKEIINQVHSTNYGETFCQLNVFKVTCIFVLKVVL